MKDSLNRTLRGPTLKYGAALGAAAGLALAGAASANVVSATSTGYGVSANLMITGGASFIVSPAGMSTGNAPPAYNHSGSLASLNMSSALGTMTTAALSSTAVSNVDGLFGVRTTSASGTTNNLNFSLLPGPVSLLVLSATSLNANASVTGDFGALNSSGSSTVNNGTINILGANFNISASAAANTVLFNSNGLKVTINEQIVTGNGTSSRGIEVNAIHIAFTNFTSAVGVLNGNVIISHAQASMNAVPAPAGAAAITGLAGLGLVRRRRPPA